MQYYGIYNFCTEELNTLMQDCIAFDIYHSFENFIKILKKDVLLLMDGVLW